MNDGVEQALREAFAEALGLEQIAPDDDFFQFGGHSLLVMRAAARIDATLGIDLPVSVIFQHPTARRLAAHVATIGLQARAPRPSSIVTAATDDLRLSPLQRGMWFLDQGVGWHAAYLLPDAWRLREPLDTEALQRALHALICRHSALSAGFVLVDGTPRRRIVDAGPFTLSVHDLGALPPGERDTMCSRLIDAEANRPFDLAHDLLIRASLLRLEADDHILLITAHHLAADAWSLHILRRELGELYRDCRAGISPVTPSSSRDDATGSVPEISAARRETLLAYWRRQLHQLPVLELPTDRHRLSVWTDVGGEFEFTIAPDLTRRLELLASSCGATQQMLLLAAFQLLLARYSGQDDFGVATFASNRPDEARDAIGLFVNTIVLRANLAGAPTFRALLARVRQTSLEGADHRDLPFDTLVSGLRADRQAGPRPFTGVAFQYLPIADAPPAFDGIEASRVPNPTGRVRFDLEFTIRKETERCHALVAYNSSLWDGETIARLADQYTAILRAIADAPDVSLAELSSISDEERDEQLTSWSGVDRLPGVQGVVHHLFEAQAAAAPQRVALTCGEKHVSYGELAAGAARIASLLRAEGIGAGHVVAIVASDTIALVAAMVGILKVGAAYMPLDTGHPADRLRFMLRHAGAAAILCTSPPEWLGEGAPRVIVAPDGMTGPVAIAPSADRPITPDAPAYVMFTSGSTGRPKGVIVAHRGITRLVVEADYVDFTAEDAVAFASNPAFDAATFEIWGALLNGARLIEIDRETLLSPRRLAEAIVTHRISVMFLTSALFHQVAAIAPDSFTGLRCLVVGGDVVDPGAAATVLRASRPGRLVNGYGPTENTTFSATFRITSEHPVEQALPIGRPVPGSTCYVLDDNQSLLPVGAVGELYVGGAGLSLGYVNDDALTAARFLPHPFSTGQRLYRTGDHVRWRWDGQLDFLGRADRQVKLRGHRIELEEIERTLSQHPAVTASAVVMEGTPSGQPRLVTYVSIQDGRAASVGGLTNHLRQSLPDFMIPATFVELPALPMTTNGKVDRAALKAAGASIGPAPDTELAGPLHTASSLMETLVMTAFQKVLGIDRVQPDDDFFDLGGDSLLSIRLATELTDLSGRAVSVAHVFAHPRVSELCAMLNDGSARSAPRTLVEVRAGGPGTPIYFPPGALGEVLVTPALRDALPKSIPIYAFRDPLDAGHAASMEAMAARLCADLVAFQPEGPVSLAGYSFAGLLAYEMARQLKAAGREIRLLAIFDTVPDLSAGGSDRDVLARVRRCLANLPDWIAEDLIRSMDRNMPGRLWRSIKKYVRVGFRYPVAAPGVVPRVDHLFDVSQWTPELYAYVENNLRILGAFHYRPYDGDIVLFRARARPLFHAQTWDLGWQSLARAVRVIPTPGNHHTLMLEPHIHHVARSLAAVVAGASPPATANRGG